MGGFNFLFIFFWLITYNMEGCLLCGTLRCKESLGCLVVVGRLVGENGSRGEFPRVSL